MDGADPANGERVCEGYYYAGEACLLQDQFAEARAWFRRCVETGLRFDPHEFPPNPMNEYHLAVWRLDVIDGRGDPTSRPGGR